MLNICDGAFYENSERLKTAIIFAKSFIIDVWQGSKYAYDRNLVFLLWTLN